MYRITQLQEEKKKARQGKRIAVVSETRQGPIISPPDHVTDEQAKGKLELALPSNTRHIAAQEHQVSMMAKGGLQLAPGFDSSHRREEGNRSSTPPKGAEGPQIAPAIPYSPRRDNSESCINEEVENLEAGISTLNEDEQDEEPPGEEPPSAIEGVLAPTADQARARMLEEAIEASDVHLVTSKKKRMWITVAVVAIALILAAVGGTLGAVLGRKDGVDPTEVPTAIPTDPPTLLPTSPRFAEVAALIELSFGTFLNDSSSPQHKAADWIANVDVTFDLTDEARFRQRYALAVFYYTTGGATSWIRQANFLSPGVHECDWKEPVSDPNFHYNENGIVVCIGESAGAIIIESNNMTGSIPEEIGALSRLGILGLLLNNLEGPLPASLFNLTELLLLVLPKNNFTGTMSTAIGQLTRLTHLWFEDATFDSTIPSEIGLLTDLTLLGLNKCSLHGSLPEQLNQLSNLQLLTLMENDITGTVHNSFPLAWPNLTLLGLGWNSLNGTIPQNMHRMSSIQGAWLNMNEFTGPFPESFAALHFLQNLSLDENHLTGSLPSEWQRGIFRGPQLKELTASFNQLTGTLPTSLGELTALEKLILSANYGLNGTLPSELGRASNLVHLLLSDNAFVGTVPETFQSLTNLVRLTLEGNLLEDDLTFLCNGTKFLFPDMEHFNADCFDEIICPCCNFCCDRNDSCEFV